MLASIIALVLLSGTNRLCARNRLNSDRKQLFNYGWKFFLGDKPDAQSADFDDAGWRTLDLPHDWSIEGEIDPKNPTGTSGGYFPAGIGWYRKTFTVPDEVKGKSVSVYFEGVYMNSEVFINGHSLGVYPYGYSSFRYDLTPYLDFEKDNVLAVRVDNAQQLNSRWYSGSGIYRHVWLYVTDRVHLAPWGVAITTPGLSDKEATVHVSARVLNETTDMQRLLVQTRIISPDSKATGNVQVEIDLPPNSERDIVQTIVLHQPLLWSPETPHLYRAEVQLIKENHSIDQSTTTFGIRTIAFSSENGFLLNGQALIINGGCVHHDNGCLGAAAFDRAEERKVELLKTAGFNAVRTSHNPPSEAFLDACDRLGLLVVDEAFDGWKAPKNPYDYSLYFDDWWKTDLESMILRDRNHPSIIMWSIGNEVIERKESSAIEITRRMSQAIKEIDDTRPVTSAMTTWDNDWEIFDPLMAAHDVCGYNYQLFRASSDHERVPSRIILNTESYPRNAFSIWERVVENKYIIGDFVWTAIDYLGESGIGAWYYPGEPAGEHWQSDRYPWHGAYCGDIDLTGWRKPISHYRSMLYNDREKLYMAVREPNPDDGNIELTAWAVWPTWESWTWPGYEGKEIQVEVYAKYPKVRLYLNNQLVGEQATTPEQQFKATFALPYTPGTVKAVGVDNGKEVEACTLQTAGEAAQINLTPDKNGMIANGQDLLFINIELTDRDGIFQPNASKRLSFEVEGPATLTGLGNADLKDTDPYVGTSRKTWKGRALVVLKSTHITGEIKLKVRAEGLPDASITLQSIQEM